jgi:large subunit ribosomal protein L4
MTKLPLFTLDGKNTGEVAAPKEIFAQEPNEHAVHSALVWFLASQRRGSHSAKTRAEVRGGGKKPWRQKGTGRARAGSIRSPLWRKGGVVFGPKPRSYAFNLPRKVRKLALRVALSDMAKAGKVKVVTELKLAQAKSKLAAKALADLKVTGKTLIVLGQENEQFEKAGRNLAGVKLVMFKDVNIFDILNADWLVVEKAAISKMKETLV